MTIRRLDIKKPPDPVAGRSNDSSGVREVGGPPRIIPIAIPRLMGIARNLRTSTADLHGFGSQINGGLLVGYGQIPGPDAHVHGPGRRSDVDAAGRGGVAVIPAHGKPDVVLPRPNRMGRVVADPPASGHPGLGPCVSL